MSITVILSRGSSSKIDISTVKMCDAVSLLQFGWCEAPLVSEENNVDQTVEIRIRSPFTVWSCFSFDPKLTYALLKVDDGRCLVMVTRLKMIRVAGQKHGI
jgi:hypothetical protein